MFVTRRGDAPAYPAVNHRGVCAFRLQGKNVTPARGVGVGLSPFLPGGGAEKGSSETEKIHVVLEGSATIVAKEGEVTLDALNSCLIETGNERVVENRSRDIARMLVISPS